MDIQPGSTRRQHGRLVEIAGAQTEEPLGHDCPEHERIIQLPVPAQPPRRRSRLGEPTVRIELVVIDSDSRLGTELLRRQAAAVREAVQWFADHPPTGEPDHHDDTETEAT